MKKARVLMVVALTAMMMTVTACQKGGDSTKETKTEAGEADKKDQTEGQDSGDTAGEESLTGTLQENKIMMFILDGEDGEAYVFTLAEDQADMLDGIKEGDTLKVTFKNGAPTPDNLKTVVTKIEKIEEK